MTTTAQKLSSGKERILEIWAERVRKYVLVSHHTRKSTLLDHIPLFLDNLVNHLNGTQDEAKRIEANCEHGQQRARLEEYGLAEVFKEYELLRLTISEVMHEKGTIPSEDLNKIHQYIDQAVTKAGCEFVLARQMKIDDLTSHLQQSNQDLKRFAAIVAHDVRSPLSTIFSFAGLLNEDLGENKPPHIQTSLDIISANAQRLMMLIEKLLHYSTINPNKIDFFPVQLNQTISETLTNLTSIIEETNTIVSSEILPTIKGDSSLLIQLFQNLIANSIKFRKPNSTARIRIILSEESDTHWIFCVTDNGIGFNNELNEEIFEPLKKLHDQDEYSGSGLGLATCRRIVELHGGKIWATSEIGVGSKFYFSVAKET